MELRDLAIQTSLQPRIQTTISLYLHSLNPVQFITKSVQNFLKHPANSHKSWFKTSTKYDLYHPQSQSVLLSQRLLSQKISQKSFNFNSHSANRQTESPTNCHRNQINYIMPFF